MASSTFFFYVGFFVVVVWSKLRENEKVKGIGWKY